MGYSWQNRSKEYRIRDHRTGIRDRSKAIGSGIKILKIVKSGIKMSKNLGIKVLRNFEIRDQNYAHKYGIKVNLPSNGTHQWCKDRN